MKSMKLNQRILDAIRKNSENDESIQKFLIKMVYEEAGNPGWWKELYKKILRNMR